MHEKEFSDILSYCQETNTLSLKEYFSNDIISKYITQIRDMNEEEGIQQMVDNDKLENLTEHFL